MRSLLQRFWGRPASSCPASAPPPSRHRRLRLETLEDRLALSIANSDFRVPTTTASDQFETVNAYSADGTSVVVWTHRVSRSDTDIHAQMYDSRGQKVGGEIVVANSRFIEREPAVAMDDAGNWKVVWTRSTTSVNKDLVAARYSSRGERLGSQTVAATAKNEYNPSIACERTGFFVVTYTLDFSSDDQDIRYRLYHSAGHQIREGAVAESRGSDETHAAVAMSSLPYPEIAVAYQVGTDIRLKRYDHVAQLLSTHYVATGRDISQTEPSVSMTKFGDIMVAWQEYVTGDWDIKARGVSTHGVMGGVHSIAATGGQETKPSIAVKHDGDFVVAFQIGAVVYLQEMNADGTRRTTNPFNLGVQSSIAAPSVSIRPEGYYLVSYTDTLRGIDVGLGVYGRRGFLE